MSHWQSNSISTDFCSLDQPTKENIDKQYKMKLESLKEKASYALGTNVAASLENQGLSDIVIENFAQGLGDALAKNDLALPSEQIDAAIRSYVQEAKASQHKNAVEEGAKFLAENAKRDEVTVLESGLQYEVMVKGEGAKPKASDRVTTHYHGTLLNGTVFDSSVQRGEPASFPVNGVIQGWVEALQLMPVGSKWKLFVPYNLAYGERGAGGAITPFSTLIFEVELLSIN